MIKLIKKDVDNGDITCKDCIWHENQDVSVGISYGCCHPILYDDFGEIIDEINEAIIECINNSKYCVLFQKK